MHSTTAEASWGLAEYAVAKRNVFTRAKELAVSDAAWYGNSTDPCSTALSTFCLDGLNHLGINEIFGARKSLQLHAVSAS